LSKRRRAGSLRLVSLLLLAAACTAEDHNTSPPADPEVAGTSPMLEVNGPLIVAQGDISCAPGQERTATSCQSAATLRLAKRYDPRVVLALGDLQYETGALSAYESSYAATWGSLKAITRPVPGNHEYGTEGAAGYYGYFENRQPGPPGYYAFDVGTWRVYALNSNCDVVDCGRQNRWLDRQMSTNPRRCTAITMHHPRYSSAKHGSNDSVAPFWQTALRHRTDVALAGHDHVYERFRRMDASGGQSATGIASFVAGAGGKTLYGFGSPVPGSAARHNRTFGVLALRLGKGSYAWEYRTIDGEVMDLGSARCV
jgi:acid phosphatase type 7